MSAAERAAWTAEIRAKEEAFREACAADLAAWNAYVVARARARARAVQK